MRDELDEWKEESSNHCVRQVNSEELPLYVKHRFLQQRQKKVLTDRKVSGLIDHEEELNFISGELYVFC